MHPAALLVDGVLRRAANFGTTHVQPRLAIRPIHRTHSLPGWRSFLLCTIVSPSPLPRENLRFACQPVQPAKHAVRRGTFARLDEGACG